MTGFLLRIIINALIVFAMVIALPGIFIDTLGGALLGVAVIGLVNAVIRPLLRMADRTVHWTQLGGLTLVANMLAVLAVIRVVPGVQISGVMTIAGIPLMTVCSCALSKIIQDR